MEIEHMLSLNLQLFGEGGGDGGAGGEGSASAATEAGPQDLSKVQYGKAAAPAKPMQQEAPAEAPAPDADAEFEELIKGKYKDQFGKRTQKIINDRFKETKSLEAKASNADKLAPIMDLLASKYGVDSTDVDKLVKAVQEDDSYYEDEALDKGLTVKQLKEMKALERENAEFKRQAEAQQRQVRTNQIMDQWSQQANDTAKVYPGFDLNAELSNQESGQRFQDLLRSGIDVRTAFEVIHKDELISGAMRYTAQQVAAKTAADIRTRGQRPVENGSSKRGAVEVRKSDPRQLTKADREEIARRVLRGEKISF